VKLATFRTGDGDARLGAVIGEGVAEISAVWPGGPKRMEAVVAGGPAMLAMLGRRLADAPRIALEDVELLAPVLHPPEFLGIGLNYRCHAEEAGLPLPDAPMVINKQTSCITGPNAPVTLPAASHQLDYEGELGIVVGRASRHMTRAQALASIFGYVVVNDFSVRDWQFRSPTVTLGKSFDTHGPFGPWIVTADALPSVDGLEIATHVNGELRQRGSTANMVFDCAEILMFLSSVMTLAPATIIATGTPAGVGLCRTPPLFLTVGDLVSVEIGGIGALRNRIVAAEPARR